MILADRAEAEDDEIPPQAAELVLRGTPTSLEKIQGFLSSRPPNATIGLESRA